MKLLLSVVVVLSCLAVSSSQPAPARVVWFGDSITIGWINGAPQIWNDKYANLPSSNFAIGGHRVQNQIDRIVNEGVLNGHNARVAVLKIGTNDLGGNRPVETVAAEIRILINIILERQPIARVLLLGILPRNGVDIATRAEAVNAIISSYDDGDRVRYLNMRDAFQNQLGVVKPELFTDGLHLTQAGYAVWADVMDPLFQELLRAP